MLFLSRLFPVGLVRLALALAAAPLDQAVLELPPHLPVELPQPLRKSIFVREAYHRIIECLRIAEGGMRTSISSGSGSAAAVGAVGPNTNQFVGTVLTGPPGAGKSSIAPLVMAHLAKHKLPVLYRYFSPRSLEQYVMLDFRTSPPTVDIEYSETPKRLAGVKDTILSSISHVHV